MAKFCYFCESKIAARDAVQTIGEQMYVLTISNSTKAIEFTEIIRDIFETNDFTDDEDFACKECFKSFTNVYKFKRSFQESIEPTNLIRNVSEFLSESEEPITVINHHSCLSLVPESKVELVNNFVRLVDSLQNSSSPAPKPVKTPKSQISSPLSRNMSIISGRSPVVQLQPTLTTSPSSRFSIKTSGSPYVDVGTSSSFNRKSSIGNPYNLTQSNVTYTETVTRKRKTSVETPEQLPVPKVSRLSLAASQLTPNSRDRKSIRGRQSVRQLDVSVSSQEEDQHDEECNEADRKLTPKEEKLLRQQIQKSKQGVRSYKCSQCNEPFANYKEIRSHILDNHFE